MDWAHQGDATLYLAFDPGFDAASPLLL